MLSAALADAISDPRASESCPTAPKVIRPGLFGGFVTGLAPAGPGTFPGSPPPAAGGSTANSSSVTIIAGPVIPDASKRLASYALLGQMVDEQRERRMREALR